MANGTFSIREQLSDAEREVTYQMIRGGGLGTMLRLSQEARAGDEKAAKPAAGSAVLEMLRRAEGVLGEELLLPRDRRNGRCQGFVNCCKCGVCTRRANGWGRWGDMPPNRVVIRDMLEEILDKGSLRDPRAGSRRRGEQRALRITRRRLHRYDFTKRQSGPGKAGADWRAISEWLTGKVVRGKDGRLWLTEEKVRNVSDYKPVLRRGRKSKEQTRLYGGLLRRVSTLVEDGAQQTSIAKVLDVKRDTIGNLLDAARRLKPL